MERDKRQREHKVLTTRDSNRHAQPVTIRAVFTLHQRRFPPKSTSWQSPGQLQGRCGHGELVLDKVVEHEAGAMREVSTVHL
eukprot:3005880-Rhodomonas_salina.1